MAHLPPGAEVANAGAEENPATRCTTAGCPGVFELWTVTHTVKHQGMVLVIDCVPAEVCNVCGDAQLAPETARRIEALFKGAPPPTRNITF